MRFGAHARSAGHWSSSCSVRFCSSPRSGRRGRSDGARNIPFLAALIGQAFTVRRNVMADISNRRVAILATDGFEQSELTVPKQRLEEAGAKVDVISLKTGEIWGWNHDDWGEPIPVDRTIDAVDIDEYDALVIPGGQINPDLLRADKDAVALVRDFYRSKKPLAAICHAPWVLIEAGIAKGRR